MPAMSNVKVSDTARSVNWKDIARLFYDFDSGEVIPLPNDCGVTDMAIQMGICARLFQNGFEEDANAVWQRMISHDRDMETREHTSALDDLLQEDASDTTRQNEATQRYGNVRLQMAPGDKSGGSERARNSEMSVLNEYEKTEGSEFDLLGTEESNDPELSSERADWSIDS